MEEKEITCTVCPQGCRIIVRHENGNITSIKGYTCYRGEEYARNEFIKPVRILTSTALVDGSGTPLVALRSNKPIPKDMLLHCMNAIYGLKLTAPVRRYDILIPNILNTGADIVATGEAL